MAIERRKDNNNRVLKDGEYQRKNGSYEYKWRDKTGERHSVYAKTLSELREKEAEVQKNISDGIKCEKSNITVNDLYNLWVQVKRGLKDNTFQNYKYMYTQFVENDIGQLKIADIKRTDVRAFYNRLAEQQHLKTSTIDCVHTVLHQVLELGVEDDYLRYNPSDNALKELKRVYGKSEKVHALTIAEQHLFEDFLSTSGKYSRWYPIFTVMLWTGMRVGEATGLRWCDVDFEKNVINVNHTLVYFSRGAKDGCCFAVNSPKTKAGERCIPMMKKVRDALLLEKQYQEETGVKCKALVDGYTDFIFVNRFGDTQNQSTLNRALKRIIRDCNYDVFKKNQSKGNITFLPHFSNHTLRHTFTTRMCEARFNVKAMQAILGHADAETTLNIYADATDDFVLSEIKELEQFYNSPKNEEDDEDNIAV